MVSFATKHNDPDANIGWGERIGYGTGQLGMNMVNAFFGAFLTIYFTNAALLDAGIVATIMAISRVFDGISDLVVGNLVDRTKSKHGKGRVWLMRMCIPFAITTVLLFFVPSSFPQMTKYVYVFLLYNIVNAVCYTAMLVPYYSMISLISRNPYERGMLGNIQQIFSTLATIIVNSVAAVLLTAFTTSTETIYTQRAFTMTTIIFCVAMVVLEIICFLFTKERVTDELKEAEAETETEQGKKQDGVNPIKAFKALFTNKYWVIITVAMFVIFFAIMMYAVGNVYYATYIFQDMGQYAWMSNTISVAQFVVMFITPFFMNKFGKTKIYVGGIGLLTIGFAGFGLCDFSLPLMMAFNVLKGIGLGMSGGMALGMVADSITYGTLKSGVDAVGMGNAGVSAAQKLGMGFGQAVIGWALAGAGFDAALDLQGIAQPEAVGRAIEFLYSWLPFAMCIIVFILMFFFYDIDKKLPGMLKETEE